LFSAETCAADPKYVSNFYHTTRRSMRRFTRLTNAFRKKVENHPADSMWLALQDSNLRPLAPRWRPVKVKGRPVSQTIIDDREDTA
jgi:hypothetical protein